jgi:geranylgeranyl diphosphate synthase type I
MSATVKSSYSIKRLAEMGIAKEGAAMPEMFNRYRPEIEKMLRSVISSEDGLLYKMMRYHLGFEDENGVPQPRGIGKALRPTLCLFSCEASGGDWDKALPAAAAIELVHNFSLIHDDIQDKDAYRRHRPTVWYVWGYPQGINAGDGMRELANKTLLGLKERGARPEKILEAFNIMTACSLEMIAGQTLDLSYERRLDITAEDYLKMVSWKTGALIECSLHIGALLGTDDQRLITAFRQCGRSLGFAFQIRDDILGIWGDEATTGKSSASDIRRKKKSLPVVYALEHATRDMRSHLTEHYSQEQLDEAGAAAVLSILERLGAKAYAQRMVEERCSLALSRIADLKLPDWARSEMEKLVAFLLDREL